MKGRFIIAAFIGLFVAALAFALQLAIDNRVLATLSAPGVLTIALIWGPHGPVPSDALAIAIVIFVNAVVYGLIALVIVKISHAILARSSE